MRKRQIVANIRPALADLIQTLKKETGHSQSRIIEEAIEQGIKRAETLLRKRTF